MKTLMSWLLVMSFASTGLLAEEITIKGGKKVEIGEGKDFGTSHGYNPKDTWHRTWKRAKQREADLKKVAQELEDKLKKAKKKADKDKLADQLDKTAKEKEKNREEWKFEEEMNADPNKPKHEPARGKWKRDKRKERKKKLDDKQLELELKRKKEAEERAKKLKELKGIGVWVMRDVTDSTTSVSDAIKDQSDAQDDFAQAGCEDIDDDNFETCNDLQVIVSETSATLEQEESRFKKVVGSLPPVILAGGAIFHVYEGLTKIHQKYKAYLVGKRNYENCEERCVEIKEEMTDLYDSLKREELIQSRPIEKLEDDHQASELVDPVEAELIVPDYLSTNTEVPFGNREALPLAFGLQSWNEASAFKNVRVLVNGQYLDADYYPEAGVIKATYVGFDKKQDFKGQVLLESVDGQVFSKAFAGRINTTKPTVSIKKQGGGLFSKAKFKVQVKGEFDQVKVSGVNVKAKTFKYDSIQKKKDFTIKTLSRGAASIKVEASLRTKIAKVPDTFGDDKLETNSVGRIINPETKLFSGLSHLQESNAKVELGFCCEEVGDLTCVGCIGGKRSRKSCKALNRLPGYNFKAFLSADDLKCTNL